MGKPIPPVVLFLLFVSLANSFKLSYSVTLCPKIEEEALLSFKQSLVDPSNRLSSWNTSNCCNWKGVVCSNLTGNVLQLHLQGDWFSRSNLYGKVNPGLLQLKHLKYLDLSQNDFDGRIPSFMGSLTGLEYLNLSYTGFYGKIPATIGNLSRLRTLSLESYYQRKVEVDSLEWLRSLSQLEHLVMENVNLSKAGQWMQVINELPSLVKLHLKSCNLDFTFDPPSDVNMTSLEILDLSFNKFGYFSIPKWIFKQSNLVFLDLSGSDFGGMIPPFSNITKLQHIDLSGIQLNSTIPDWLYSCKDLEFVTWGYNSIPSRISNAIGNLTSLTHLDLSTNLLSGAIPRGILNLCKLQRVDLSNNMLLGEISNTFGNTLDCFLGALIALRLSGNQLSSHLTHRFGEYESLQELDVSGNSLTGEIPINLGNLSHLKTLGLRDNNLTGNLPMSMGQLSNLSSLDVGNNMMTGVVTETHFTNLTKLNIFMASGNHLTLKLSPDWDPPFRLQILRLGSWNLGADIPSWLDTQINTIQDLDLSQTGVSGSIPTWFWELAFLNLSHNHLYGNIPDLIGYEYGPWSICLTSNQLSGPLPRLGNHVVEVNLANNSFAGGISHFLCDMRNGTYRLENLHLGGNQLTGEIPDCWSKWSLLRMVNIGDNSFSGSIPNSIGTLAEMRSLNLYNNKLSGPIPVSISNCTGLVKMDLSSNNLEGNIPTWIGTSLTKLKFLILRSNKVGGTIPWSICHLNSLQILDLSNNSLSGRIPSCLYNLTAITEKRNLSKYIGGELDFSSYYDGGFLESASVATKGRETHYDTILSLVNNIDLSNNHLSGGIPKELTNLVELVSLNLSGNHLTGSIPDNIGDMKQLESLDLSRNTLSGEMPNSFSAMSSLSYLNLSWNNLIGRIPESTQLMGMNASSFVGNDLCGPPLTRKCRGDDDAVKKEDNQDEKSEIEWFYVLLSLGYAVGFSVFCSTLILKKSWRRAYFRLLECTWEKLCVYYYIKCTKLTRQRAQTS